MKNNLIELSAYRDVEAFDFAGYNRRAELRFRSSQIRYWLTTIMDLLVTASIAGCTVFCCYLAWTML